MWTQEYKLGVPTAPVKKGAEATLYKALALRHIELPVKDLLEQGLQRDLPSTPGIVEALHSNQKDEERHDEALNYVAQAYGINAKAESEVMNILKVWMEHPAHPIHKVAIIERSVFFVALPFFRFNGNIGMRTVSADISRDEQVHCGVHGLVAKELNQKDSESLNKLRAATAAWLFDDLGKSDDKWLDKDAWMNRSKRLFWEGKAPDMVESRASRMISFFESSNVNLPSYGAA
ncbi:MAG: ferritin-like domain-containing protein [Actinobacteria bacterium]|nr:ferritin-like domain-containing protein [Actinomycetota bacterium]